VQPYKDESGVELPERNGPGSVRLLPDLDDIGCVTEITVWCNHLAPHCRQLVLVVLVAASTSSSYPGRSS
jgi:hypothetical protein